MNLSFSPNCVRPNRPLRKPSSSPGANVSTSLPSGLATINPPIRPALGGVGNGSSAGIMDSSPVLGLAPPALTVYLCNYCGQQGNFRCKRCKKIPYCSVVCQTEDWKAHRHTCKPIDPEPEKEKPKESTSFSTAGDRACLAEMKPSDSFSFKRVYLKDLGITKIIEGTDIQASVVEVYSPGRFFLLAQIPEVMEALQSISTELQKACSDPSGTLYVPCVGEVCAVTFSCDMNWYRGLVQTLAADQKMASILYIDFGNEEIVPVDRIRPLPANIKPFPPCAMECRIAGVVPVFNNWSGECCLAVKQLLAGRIVTVKLLETRENSRVHVVDILLSLGKQLSTFLIKEGFAQKETVDAAPTEQDINAMLNASLENFKCLSDGKDDNKWAQPPEPLAQFIGDQFSVVVTHFQSPNDLIVQKVENAGAIQDLQLKLRQHCSQVAIPQNFRPAPGTVCCAMFSEDKQWYRAKVLAYSSEKRVCVGYIDFGNSEEVDLNHLRPISTSLLALPVQAMPFGLAGVQPVEDIWSKDCLLALQCRLSNRILHSKILGAHEGRFLVEMIDEASDPWVNMAELLITAGYAAPAAVTASAHLQAAEHSESPPVSEHLVWSVAELPTDGQTVALLASVIESPGKFYCRFSSPTEHQNLKELRVQLKQQCEAHVSPFVPNLGEPCCAVFPGDGAWCRAMVKGLSDGKATVNFVDYGYSMTVENSHLRPISPKLLTLPFQAVCCWLAGVEPLGSEWSSEALLWFQALVDGEQLSARVLTVTEQGYGLELQSRGKNVAASLISEQLAKASGENFKESPVKMSSITKQQDVMKQNEDRDQACSQAEANSKERTKEEQTSVASEVASFPVDWKTVELPLNETFQPFVAAVINPSLFYLFGHTQVDQQRLQEVMIELSSFCCNKQNILSAAVNTKPAPGAACCAQFSADHNWYRAVVLEVGENEMSILYADYGNSEIVPFSRILPIPAHLLQLPFQVIRCTLTEKEHFPAAWPEEVQQVFRAELANGILATAQHFDGFANVLSLTLPTERGGGNLATLIFDTLHTHSKSNRFPDASQKSDKTGSSTSESSAAAPEPDCPQPKLLPDSQNQLENKTGPVDTTMSTKSPEPTVQSISTASVGDPVKKIVNQMEPPYQNNSNVTEPQTSSCNCQYLKKQINNLEHIMEQVMERMKQMQLQFILIKELEQNKTH